MVDQIEIHQNVSLIEEHRMLVHAVHEHLQVDHQDELLFLQPIALLCPISRIIMQISININIFASIIIPEVFQLFVNYLIVIVIMYQQIVAHHHHIEIQVVEFLFDIVQKVIVNYQFLLQIVDVMLLHQYHHCRLLIATQVVQQNQSDQMDPEIKD